MNVFMTGSTGYIARALAPALLERGHTVRGLVRPWSVGKLPEGVTPVVGDALDASTFVEHIAPCDTFIQLVGVAHPSPAKAKQFRDVDLVSVRQSVRAAKMTSIQHFIYLSVAMPAPVMKDYVAVREEGERLLRWSGIPSTFVRPWYVLGPGHWWPYAILPLYWIWGAFPAHRDTARRLYPVTLRELVDALIDAVESPADPLRIIEAPEMSGPVAESVPTEPLHKPSS